jgi:hypothetical protein
MVMYGYNKNSLRFFKKSAAKCLEYVETSSVRNFMNKISVSVHDKVKSEIMAELKKYQTSKGIESIYYDLFALAEKSLDNSPKKLYQVIYALF